MREQAVVIGDDPGLVGVLTRPPESNRGRGVVILNAGLLHRVGPNRLHVRMARRLAGLGFPVLRFDFSGQGDSDGRADGLSHEESTVVETRAAVDLLQAETGVRECVLIGICSGADAAFRAAQGDERVGGVVMVECFAFESRGFRAESFLRRVVSPAAWARRLRRLLAPSEERVPMRRDPADREDLGGPAETIWNLPPAARVREGIERLLSRGTRFCFIFSSEGPSYFHYRWRLRRPGRRARPGAVDVRLCGHTDHTFTHLSRQSWLLGQIEEWAVRMPPGPAADGS